MPALAKDPNARYQTAAEMARALEQAIVKLDQPFESQLNALYAAGLQAFQAGQWEQASRYLRQVIAYNPDYEDASDLLEAARGAQRAYEEARSLLRSRSASAANQRVTVPATPAAQFAERTTESAAMHDQPTDPSAPSPTEGRRRGPRRMMPAMIAGMLVLLVVGTLIWRTGLLANIPDRATPQPPTTAQNAVAGQASRTIAAAPITAEPLLSPAGRTAQTQPSNTATTAPSGTPSASDTPVRPTSRPGPPPIVAIMATGTLSSPSSTRPGQT